MDATTLTCWRAGLGLILAAEGGVLAYAAWSLQRFKPITDGNPIFLGLASNALLLGAVYALTLVALIGFLGPRGRMMWGVVALAGMKILFEVFATIYSAHHQDFFQTGAVLMGLLLGEAYAYCIGVRERRSQGEWLTAKGFGVTAGLAVFAASYVCAGTGKVLYGGGLNWIESATIRLMVLSHTEVGTHALKDAIGHFVGGSALVGALLQIGTVVIQVGAFMLMGSPRMRTLWAVLIVLFHIGIYVTSNILFLQPLVFAAIIAVPWSWMAVRLWGARIVPVDLETESTWATSPEAIVGGQRRWLKMSLALVAVLWLTSHTVVYADHWVMLAGKVMNTLGYAQYPADGRDGSL